MQMDLVMMILKDQTPTNIEEYLKPPIASNLPFLPTMDIVLH